MSGGHCVPIVLSCWQQLGAGCPCDLSRGASQVTHPAALVRLVLDWHYRRYANGFGHYSRRLTGDRTQAAISRYHGIATV